MTLQRLFKPTKSGKTQICDIIIQEDTFTVIFGQLDGKQQQKTTICTPKNLGKSNETTSERQAMLEAQAKWESKLKNGYSQELTTEYSVQLPMKVKNLNEHLSKLVYPVSMSPKLDGVNSEFRLIDGTFKLLSRGGEDYPIVPERDNPIKLLMEKHNLTSINGEFYKHNEYLQDITSAIRKPGPKKLNLEFYAFDLPNVEGDWKVRSTLLKMIPIRQVASCEINSYEELLNKHQYFLDTGYEGSIIRNYKGLYEYNTRSNDVFKLKVSQEAEFKVLGFIIDKNQHPVWIAETKAGNSFKFKMKGTAESRLAMAKQATTFIGKWATVEYETLSKPPSSIPLKPVGIRWRAMKNGEPSE